ncbi:hypothetical protein MCOR27_002512 [Pyricularia oryzae]|uniref:NAD dependent epimerase/dehydratase n=1 Tax=Pyricularia oryzae TaxID=318829 RepID=A0A4P7N9X4_PYROR|nr:hypothetical protein MCOR02_009879 [Pyricularia oryzae]KAI6277101.1 hypothetical protein MCOR26_005302 [Pyricularia oryzae]KAI6284957.1 hypothetical protein MCOR27_002512 [Pyricularia oryzae]KAI6385652.1 hypothetical protein MCOR32_001312 [Pyricularia oryzae]KAI6402265.1 hypothetical protein MCOR20_007750 [Pyricularia oryzae]
MAPQVLVLGMPRTGTQSIGQALQMLGLGESYHMTTVGPNNHHDAWCTAIEAKFGEKDASEVITQEFFDDLFKGYDAVSDFPASIFYKELLAAYPNAHVILTKRAEDAWFESMCKTLHVAYIKAKAEPSKLAKLYHQHLWADNFLRNGREAYRRHNAGVMAAAADRKVLVFDPSMGWGPLCEFLGKDVPAVGYPSKDMWQGYKRMLKEVEEGRLTEDAITIGARRAQGPKINSAYIYTQSKDAEVKGIKSAYIYTQSKEAEVKGIKSAYIYTQSKEAEVKGIKSAYIYTQQKESADVKGIKSAYIYTQQKEAGAIKSTGEGIKSAYIYTQQKESADVKGIKSAYIYTQQKEAGAIKSTGEGIKSAYIYTQQKESNDVEGIRSAYIYTQQKETDLKTSGEGIKSAYIYTQQKEAKDVEGIRSAYIYTQQKEAKDVEGIKSAYIYTQQKETDLKTSGEGIKSAYIYTQQKEAKDVEGIKSAYIYTQQKEAGIEGIKSAYIYTQ